MIKEFLEKKFFEQQIYSVDFDKDTVTRKFINQYKSRIKFLFIVTVMFLLSPFFVIYYLLKAVLISLLNANYSCVYDSLAYFLGYPIFIIRTFTFKTIKKGEPSIPFDKAFVSKNIKPFDEG